jgi:isoprenylcysteine carboxyl methyltransferase (ICMT) family protein YpbQ
MCPMLSGNSAVPPNNPSASSTSLPERAFVWAGGALFVGSLTATVYAYALGWSAPRAAGRIAWTPLAANSAWFLVFALHHSLFARERVKAWFARYVPDRLLRSVYVWIASALWLAVIAAWTPLGGLVFEQTAAAARLAHAAVQAAGLWLIARSAGAIDPLELAGIRASARPTSLQARGPYRLVRHPLYLGWILVVFGAATMTADRLVFAVMSTLYLVVAIPWEERSLERAFGEAYGEYRARVRWRVIPYVY